MRRRAPKEAKGKKIGRRRIDRKRRKEKGERKKIVSTARESEKKLLEWIYRLGVPR